MPVDVSIIEIDLGVDVQKIIDNEVISIDQGLQTKLDRMKEELEAVARVKTQKQSEKDAYDTIMENAIKNILEAGANGVKQSDLLKSLASTITTVPALTTRLKTYLRKNGNKYVLIHSNKIYRLMAYNQE